LVWSAATRRRIDEKPDRFVMGSASTFAQNIVDGIANPVRRCNCG